MRKISKKLVLSLGVLIGAISLSGCDGLYNNIVNPDESVVDDKDTTGDEKKDDETVVDDKDTTGDETVDVSTEIKEKLTESVDPNTCNVTDFRLSQFQMDVDQDEGIAKIYNIELKNGEYDITIGKIIRRENEYIHPNDVAAYIQAFNDFPSNYFVKDRKKVVNHGPSGRLISIYYRNPNRPKSYCRNMGPWVNEDGGEKYYELDISTSTMNPGYNKGTYGSKLRRGTYRLVYFPGTSQKRYVSADGKTNEAVTVFTSDHYAHFVEYYNFNNGWGKSFNGDVYEPDDSRPNVQTIELDFTGGVHSA